MRNKAGHPPSWFDLFSASLVATAIVYLAGVLIFCILSFFAANGGGWELALQNLVMAATMGLFFAALAAFVVVAPLGTLIGAFILRLSRPGWWQGPLTGVLVALALEAVVLLFGAWAGEAVNFTPANMVSLAIPIALATVAGALVQRRMLRWPRTSPQSEF